jgi:hypothetical protein
MKQSQKILGLGEVKQDIEKPSQSTKMQTNAHSPAAKIVKFYHNLTRRKHLKKENVKSFILRLQNENNKKLYTNENQDVKDLILDLQNKALHTYNNDSRVKLEPLNSNLYQHFINLKPSETQKAKANELKEFKKDKKQIDKPDAINGLKKKVQKEAKVKKKPKAKLQKQTAKKYVNLGKLPDVLTTSEIAKLHFEVLNFDGDFLKLIGDKPAVGFYGICYAKPKKGKSNFSYQFAKYMSKFGDVCYCAAEEGISHTTKQKIILNGLDKISNVHVVATRNIQRLRDELKKRHHVIAFIDSVNMLHANSEDIEKLRKEFPRTAFFVILQVTKSGAFRGEQNWEHNCDCVFTFPEKGIVSQNGRFGSGYYSVFGDELEDYETDKQ